MEYEAIFKHGDDLRQDQLILQMITLMDKLLRRENLDLKLTPYKVLATSSKHGFLQVTQLNHLCVTNGWLNEERPGDWLKSTKALFHQLQINSDSLSKR